MIAKLLAVALLLAAPFTLPTDTEPWQSTLTSPWGTGSLRAGLGGAQFVATTMAPARWSPILREYRGMALQGDVFIASEITTSAGVTITAALDDLGTPDNIVLTSTCQYEAPVGAAAYVSGTVSLLTCRLGGDCTLYTHLEALGAETCP